MKVAIITGGFLPIPAVQGGGVESQIMNLIDENEKQGKMQFLVFSIINEKAQTLAKNYRNTEFVYMFPSERSIHDKIYGKIRGEYPLEYPINFRKVAEIIKQKKVDKIIIENNQWQLPFFSRLFGKKVFLHTHNDRINVDILSKDLNHYIKAINNCGGVLAISEFMKKRIDDVGVRREVKVLLNALNIEKMKKKLRIDEIAIMKQKLGIQGDDIVFIYTGRLCEDKGVIELVKAYKNFVKKHNNTKLLLVGSVSYAETTYDEYTDKLFEEIGEIKDSVIATGFVPYEEIYKYYSLADIHIIPSLWDEPFGLVALEGMAQKLPIISTRSGGLDEVLDDDCSIYVSRDYIVEDLKEAMIKLIENKELREKMGTNGYNRIVEYNDFGIKEYYNHFYQFISE